MHARAVIMREAVERETRPSAERRLAGLARRLRRPGDLGVDTRALVRHIRDRGRDARRRLPRRRWPSARRAS